MVPVREPKKYTVLLADDLALVREGLAALCQGHPPFRVVAQCSEGAEALRVIELQRPDIAVLDLSLSDLHTLEFNPTGPRVRCFHTHCSAVHAP
jgi:DNA-binding NarL/FixJ family response regulator